MMRPIRLGGDQMIFGEGCLAHLKTLDGKRAFIVTAGRSMVEGGALARVRGLLEEGGMAVDVMTGVEPDPGFETVMRGAKKMQEFQPDWIVALGGGSAMDAAKAMWVYYEHPELTKLSDLLPPKKIPKLRGRARMVCIPSTAGTASEVSRSIVITDNETHIKHGIGDMEMMPDVAICDPEITATMPPKITADTGMDALTHALEALVSTRAHFLSDILTRAAVRDIMKYLPLAYRDGKNLAYREKMLNASTVAGMAFTNVSLGIVHSMAHTLGSVFSLPHGLSNAVLLPYVMQFNAQNAEAAARYQSMADELGEADLILAVRELRRAVGIPDKLHELVPDRAAFTEKLHEMAEMALADGCTKTNPIIPTVLQLEELYMEAYE